tara:strand:+ start:3585 stop:3998 length:414 start_codon:yes stop_codon:yes gene_type:complete
MPIIKQTKRINPLDLNRNVKIGVAFPLDENNMFSGTETQAEQNKSNLLNLLLTEPGERVNEPDFGIGLKKLLFEQEIDLVILKEMIQSQIQRYIPDIKLNNVFTRLSEKGDILNVSLTYQNKFNPNQQQEEIVIRYV